MRHTRWTDEVEPFERRQTDRAIIRRIRPRFPSCCNILPDWCEDIVGGSPRRKRRALGWRAESPSWFLLCLASIILPRTSLWTLPLPITELPCKRKCSICIGYPCHFLVSCLASGRGIPRIFWAIAGTGFSRVRRRRGRLPCDSFGPNTLRGKSGSSWIHQHSRPA